MFEARTTHRLSNPMRQIQPFYWKNEVSKDRALKSLVIDALIPGH